MNIEGIISTFIQENPNYGREETLININEILEEAKNKINPILTKTQKQLNDDIYNYIHFDMEIYEKLKNNYFVVSDVSGFVIGRYIRWLVCYKATNETEENIRLNLGAFIVNIIDDKEKIIIRCKTIRGKFIQFYFDDTIVFQKLTDIEQFIIQNNGE